MSEESSMNAKLCLNLIGVHLNRYEINGNKQIHLVNLKNNLMKKRKFKTFLPFPFEIIFELFFKSRLKYQNTRSY